MRNRKRIRKRDKKWEMIKINNAKKEIGHGNRNKRQRSYSMKGQGPCRLNLAPEMNSRDMILVGKKSMEKAERCRNPNPSLLK